MRPCKGKCSGAISGPPGGRGNSYYDNKHNRYNPLWKYCSECNVRYHESSEVYKTIKCPCCHGRLRTSSKFGVKRHTEILVRI